MQCQALINAVIFKYRKTIRDKCGERRTSFM